MELAQPDSSTCADGWAYAFVNVGSGQGQITVTTVFEAEGQFRVVQDRADVRAGPGDQVPASIHQDACETNDRTTVLATSRGGGCSVAPRRRR